MVSGSLVRRKSYNNDRWYKNYPFVFAGKVIGQKVEGGAFHEVPPLDAIEKLLAELLLNFPVNERAIKEKILAVWKAGHEQGVSDTLTNMRERFEELASQKKSE